MGYRNRPSSPAGAPGQHRRATTLASSRFEDLEAGDDLALLNECLDILAAHRFPPRRPITYEDLLDIPVTGIVEFRSRPLTSLLMLRGQWGEPLFPRVFVDDHDRARTSILDIKHFVRELAERAGTAPALGPIDVLPNRGTISSGLLRLTIHGRVHQHYFHLEPGFGDPDLETELPSSVAPPEHRAANVLMGLGQQPVILWLVENTGEELLDTLAAENRHRPHHWR